MADGATEFDSTGDYLTVTSANMNFGSNSYTVELFFYMSAIPTGEVVLFGNYTTLGSYAIKIFLSTTRVLTVELVDTNNATFGSSSTTGIVPQTWYHVAVSGGGTSHQIFVNGTSTGTYNTAFGALRACTAARVSYQASGKWLGSISNLRVVNGSLVYSANFSVPTARLTAVANTKLLTCVEHNSLTDQSGLAQTITQTGSPTPILSSPFTNYFGVISREDFNPYSNIPEQNQRWQTFDNRVRYR